MGKVGGSEEVRVEANAFAQAVLCHRATGTMVGAALRPTRRPAEALAFTDAGTARRLAERFLCEPDAFGVVLLVEGSRVCGG